MNMLPALRPGQPADISRSDDADHNRYRPLLSYAFSTGTLEGSCRMVGTPGSTPNIWWLLPTVLCRRLVGIVMENQGSAR